MGVLDSLKTQLGLLILPLVISEGYKTLPDKAKAPFCINFASVRTELGAIAAKTETPLDDKVVESCWEHCQQWATEAGYPTLLSEADKFVSL